MDSEHEPRRLSWFVFRDLPPGAPIVFPPPLFLGRACISRPDPRGKGRGGCGSVLAPEGAVEALI